MPTSAPTGSSEHNISTNYAVPTTPSPFRVVYALVRTATAMKIVVIAARSDNEVYDLAAQRMKYVQEYI